MVKKMHFKVSDGLEIPNIMTRAASEPRLGFLCKDCSGQLLGVCDVGAPGHHSAHQFGGEDVAQVDVNLLPGIAVAVARRRFWGLLHVRQGRGVGGHQEVAGIRLVGSAGRVRGVGWRLRMVYIMRWGRVKTRVG